jgi:hypothetical protein
VRAQVEERLRQERASEIVEKLGKELVNRLRKGEAPADAATAAKAQWAAYDDVKRRDRGPGAEERSLAFKMPRPSSTDAPIVDGIATAGGDFVIVQLVQVNDKVDDEKQLQNIHNLYKAGMTRSIGGLAFQNLLDALRDASDVVVHEDRF